MLDTERNEIPQFSFSRLYGIQGRQTTIMPCFDDNQEVRDDLFAALCATPDLLHTLQQVDTLLRVYDNRPDKVRLASIRDTTQ
jgi:hypothetical protein